MTPNRLLTAFALCLCLAPAARADLVIDGRAAQALHCSAMLIMVSGLLENARLLTPREASVAQLGAVVMLDHVPGTVAQKKQAMRQRVERILRSRTLPELAKEYRSTAKWCNANFLPK